MTSEEIRIWAIEQAIKIRHASHHGAGMPRTGDRTSDVLKAAKVFEDYVNGGAA